MIFFPLYRYQVIECSFVRSLRAIHGKDADEIARVETGFFFIDHELPRANICRFIVLRRRK